MRNIIQIKKAGAVEVGDYVLSPQCSTGILLANKVVSTEMIDEGKRVELGTMEQNGKRLYIVRAEDTVVVVI